jgi:hypothetical protein
LTLVWPGPSVNATCVSLVPSKPTGDQRPSCRVVLTHRRTGLRVSAAGRVPRSAYGFALEHLSALVRAYEVLDLQTPLERQAGVMSRVPVS